MIKLTSREGKEVDLDLSLLKYSKTLDDAAKEFPNMPIPLPIEKDILTTLVTCLYALDKAEFNILNEPIFALLYQLISQVQYDQTNKLIKSLDTSYYVPLLEAVNYLDVVSLIDIFAYFVAKDIWPRLKDYRDQKGGFNLYKITNYYEPTNLMLEAATGTKRISKQADFLPGELMRYIIKHLFIFSSVSSGLIDNGVGKTVADTLIIDKSSKKIKSRITSKFSVYPGLGKQIALAKLNLTSLHGIESYPEASEYSFLNLCENHIVDPYVDTYPISSPFSNFSNLTELNLYQNHLVNLPVDFFKGLDKLEILYLHHNGLEELPDKLLYNLPNLTEINLSSNWLTNLSVDFFSQQINLISVDLSFNKFRTSPKFNFHIQIEKEPTVKIGSQK